ncbi:penicillin-binding protein [Thauera sp. CAU 1555]|uniref:peptidoglycan glycosyltransferase n=1 Tax=Thauera sedimentorum TaxID=2767595 RepID=A0ABR9BBF1_9RHOO|nr:transglycosylase domain-containing protein [Thauera sedimentorum]MBC9072761.1 penicillin-binding protein [Thauera sedimentorum]MBD8503680.1 penicillin-binding protein [Thauera sedimentorum]
MSEESAPLPVRRRRAPALFALLIVTAGGALAVVETRTSWLQAKYLSHYAAGLDYRLLSASGGRIVPPRAPHAGPRAGNPRRPQVVDPRTAHSTVWPPGALLSVALFGELRQAWFSPYREQIRARPGVAAVYPAHGPFDRRLGYARLPRFIERLGARGYELTHQAYFSAALFDYASRGYFPPYREKTRAGLRIDGCRAERLYAFDYPFAEYRSFDEVPRVVADSLLFIENRDLLDATRPWLNPAVDWKRFGLALFSRAARVVDEELDAPGGSTLATQIEKYRHSPDGVTPEPREKLRQMVSASVRAYQGGRDTLPARRQVLLDYLNTVPLSAAPVHGEVHGLGDGLWVWFAADLATVNRLLAAPPADDAGTLAAQGLALRQVLALMIAHRRPSWYLGRGREELASLTDAHLRLLGEAGLVGVRLRDAALSATLRFRDPYRDPPLQAVASGKGATAVRNRLAALLDLLLYELDRIDATVTTTLHRDLQAAVGSWLLALHDPDTARERGLAGERLIDPARARDIHYSFTLFERAPGGVRVRVQTDTTEQPFDINEGSKLELGSTAKLRVLATYLEIVAELHARFAPLPADALREAPVDRQDILGRWARDYLLAAADRSLPAMLDAALERRYPANTAELFFTGGGVHAFGNFRREDEQRIPTVREALQASINLPFVRLMRDIVRHAMYQVPGSTARLLEDDGDPRRAEYLARFADREGQAFLRRFWRKYQGKSADDMQAVFLDGLRPTADRLAAAWRYLNPQASADAFALFMRERLEGVRLSESRLATLYQRYAPGRLDLPDQGYVARVHPLELWLVGYLSAHPGAAFADAVAASEQERQAVYRWLFGTRARSAQDRRIHTMLEVEAFLDIHQRWARLGYPFEHLVPSLATALGSSGDRPAALAELMGIIVNDGVRLPNLRVDTLRFAAGTPYDTAFARRAAAGERVMRSEVAAALRNALSEVVEAGTARRLAGSYRLDDGSSLAVGGKTGTGDNRIVTTDARGQARGAGVALNRTATFVFFLGEHHFGTVTAYVTGPAAARHRFTSALPVSVLRELAPVLLPHIAPGSPLACEDLPDGA